MTETISLKECIDLLKKRQTKEACKQLTLICEKEPANDQALQLLGVAKHELGEHLLAIDLMNKSIQINPNNPAVYHNIAGSYTVLGKLEKAQENFRKAIALKPNYGEAYQGLSEIVCFQDNDPIIDKILNELKKQPDHKIASYLHFALGKIYDDCGKYPQAFENYSKGNQLAKREWGKAAHNKKQQDIIQVYSKDYISRRQKNGFRNKSPVFIVGMPRSGSSLLEQILSSHSKIFGTGELKDIQNISQQINRFCASGEEYPQCMNKIPNKVCRGLGEAYIQRLSTLKEIESTTRTIDKFLLNFDHIGLISDLLPQANIIHIRRHPLDTCLSCFFKHFSNGIHWSFNLQNIVDYYRNYRTIMKHWEEISPLKIQHIKYEDLITNPETISKSILNTLELDWESACLDFHKNTRAVQTASVWQVRQPIYQNSKERWQQYQEHIKTLIEGLADYIEEYEKELVQTAL